ncbi:MAG TPA: MFS transporter [Candidatus Acidoferrales bacterium]|nr:MFS transporter [Candidatus Acidoferrales bacterium]
MTRPASFHYAWVIAALTFLVLIVVAGVRSASGVLFVPLENEMGWSAATISAAVAVNVTLYGAMGPFAAALMQRIGLRWTILLALALIAASTAASSLISTPLGLVLTWGLGLGLGVGTVSMVLATVVATRWFVSRRGVVLGALTGGTATGQLVFLPLLAFIATKFGWRPVGLVVALCALVVAIPIAFFMRDQPEDLGLQPLGATKDTPRPPSRTGNPLRNAFAVLGRASRTRDFWLVGGTFFVCGASTNGFIGTHFIAACGDYGIPEVHAAGLLAFMGVFSLIGTTLSGWLSDKFESRYLLFVFYASRGLALLVVPFALAGGASAFVLPAFMIFYGLDWLATVAPNVRALTEALGKDDAPIAFGWISVMHQVGAGTIALVAGVVRTDLGSYNDAFSLSAGLCFVAALAALGIGLRRPRVAAYG